MELNDLLKKDVMEAVTKNLTSILRYMGMSSIDWR